jgi:hypothetical protein
MFVLFPAACRRVGLPVVRVARHAVWPTLVVGLSLTGMRRLASGTLLAVVTKRQSPRLRT